MWRKVLNIIVGAANSIGLTAIWGLFTAENAKKDIGEQTLPAFFDGLKVGEGIASGSALVGAVEAFEKGEKVTGIQQSLAALTSGSASYFCSIAEAHGKQAESVFGDPEITKVFAANGFIGVFSLATLNSLIGAIVAGFKKHDTVGVAIQALQCLCNVFQAVSVQKVIKEKDPDYGYFTTVASALNGALGFFNGLRGLKVPAEDQQRLLTLAGSAYDAEAQQLK